MGMTTTAGRRTKTNTQSPDRSLIQNVWTKKKEEEEEEQVRDCTASKLLVEEFYFGKRIK
jgi:hypothetical protein